MKNTLIKMWLIYLTLFNSAAHASPLDRKISVNGFVDSEFVELCRALDVLCGIELVSGPREVSETFSAVNVSGRSAIAHAMSRNPGHQYVFRGGILSIYPKPPRKNSLADRRISVHFSSKTLTEIGQQISNEMGIGGGVRSVGTAPAAADPTRISINAENTPIRAVLNEVVRIHGHSIWILRRRYTPGSEPLFDLEIESYGAPSTSHSSGNK